MKVDSLQNRNAGLRPGVKRSDFPTRRVGDRRSVPRMATVHKGLKMYSSVLQAVVLLGILSLNGLLVSCCTHPATRQGAQIERIQNGVQLNSGTLHVKVQF